YARTRPIIERMMAAGDIDKSHGARVRYANPSTGGPVLPTMGANLAMLPKGFRGEPYRSTDSTVFVCAEGRGTTNVDGQVLEWGGGGGAGAGSGGRGGSGHAPPAGAGAVVSSTPARPGEEAGGMGGEAGWPSAIRGAQSASHKHFPTRKGTVP